jgi:hypothetical protein
MQPESSNAEIDWLLLVKAGLPPLGVAAIWGGLWLLIGPDFSRLRAILFWLIPVYSGLWYINGISKEGLKLNSIQATAHGAILGAAIGVVFIVSSGLSMQIRHLFPIRYQLMSSSVDVGKLLVATTMSHIVPAAIICAVVCAIVSSAKKQ